MSVRPSIFSYKCPHEYIKDYFSYEKTSDPSLSLRKWAEKIGFKSHMPLLLLIEKKKQFKKSFIEIFESSFSLNENESLYFLSLVNLSRATTEREKRLALMSLDFLRPDRVHQDKILEDSEVFGSWLNMAILSLCKIGGVFWSLEKIYSSLKENNFSKADIEKSIELLKMKGLIKEDKVLGLKSVHDSVGTPHDTTVKSSHEYYKQVCDLAKEAATRDFSLKKIYHCFSIPMRNDQLEKVNYLMRGLRKKLDLMSGDGNDSDEVFQVNLQFFSLSDIGEKTLKRSQGKKIPEIEL